uniref:Methyl-CpG-binding domain protein 1 n=1 Tax=Chelonoidis abingdonii TaxID=106734 RepID=A0A8C0IUQ6_CHEAB
MSEGWVDCPTLGPGWKRREAYRRSGATCGRTDTYYQGPNGEKFRSKIELTRFLGPSQDLTNFDFKNGVLRDLPPKVPRGGGSARTREGQNPRGRPDHGPGAENSAGSPPLPSRCCASCQNYFPGVMLPSQRRCRWLCPDCRGGPWLRRLKALPLLQRVGCGACQACQIPEDCGICTVCAVRAKNPELRIGRKCLLRRCLKIVKKGFGCGVCQGCQATEDCGSCYICLRRLKPGLKRQWKCLKRRCLKKKVRGAAPLSPPRRPCSQPLPAEPGREPWILAPRPQHPPFLVAFGRLCSKSRRNRKCGECEACLLKADCGRCDFCRDKPKFGGDNLKRQKCRWRQCLRFAMVGALPTQLAGSDCSGRAGSTVMKGEGGSARGAEAMLGAVLGPSGTGEWGAVLRGAWGSSGGMEGAVMKGDGGSAGGVLTPPVPADHGDLQPGGAGGAGAPGPGAAGVPGRAAGDPVAGPLGGAAAPGGARPAAGPALGPLHHGRHRHPHPPGPLLPGGGAPAARAPRARGLRQPPRPPHHRGRGGGADLRPGGLSPVPGLAGRLARGAALPGLRCPGVRGLLPTVPPQPLALGQRRPLGPRAPRASIFDTGIGGTLPGLGERQRWVQPGGTAPVCFRCLFVPLQAREG